MSTEFRADIWRMLLTYLVIVVVTMPGIVRGQTGESTRYRIVFSDDAQGLYEAPTEGTEEFMRQWFRREAELMPFDTFALMAAYPDVCLYDAKVGEVYGDRDEVRGKTDTSYGAQIRALRAAGTDVLKIAIEELKPRGIEVIAAIRMSDTHHGKFNLGVPAASKFVLAHPQYRLRQPDGRLEVVLDYSHKEFRDHLLEVWRELAESWDIDGIELDFCRWAKHFPTDKGREKAPIMTRFMGRVRQMLDEAAKKRGRKRLVLGVRVPEGLRECWLAGCDVKTWIDRGWIDYMAVSTWNETDPQLPMDEFKALAKGSNCQVLGMMGNMMAGRTASEPKILGRGTGKFKRPGYAGMLLLPDEARGCAANFNARGADGLFYWNLACNMGSKAKFATPEHRRRMREWTRASLSPQAVMAGPRRYHYLPLWKWAGGMKNYPWCAPNQSALGTMKTQVLSFADENVGRRQTYRFYMADGRGGEKLEGSLRFWVYHLGQSNEMVVDINGKPIDAAKIRRTAAGEFRGGIPGVRFEIDLADCPPFAGNNELGLTLKAKSGSSKDPYMEELDIRVE